jgi:2'-5' RNA ligase
VHPSTPADTLRLFIALWPDDGMAAWLGTLDASIGWPAGAAREAPERRHMTLHFLGAVPRTRLSGLMPALQQPFAPFDLELGRLAAWPRGLLVVEPARAEPALLELHAALAAALQREGQAVEPRPFRPHLTLARRAAGAAWPAPPPTQRWPVSAYALVASAGGRYVNLALYPKGMLDRHANGLHVARGVLSPAADPPPATARIPRARRPRPR